MIIRTKGVFCIKAVFIFCAAGGVASISFREMAVRNYVRPTVPTLAAVDAAYGVGSHTGHANMDDMAGFSVVRGDPEKPPKSANISINKGILGRHQNP